MTPIVSPTTTERILRTLGLLALFGVFSGWFFYDGTVGWPAANLAKAVEALDPVPDELPAITPGVTAVTTTAWTEDVQTTRPTHADLLEALGTPGWEREKTRDKPREIRYFGPGGVLVLTLDGDLIVAGSYARGKHDDTEIALQTYLATMLAPVVLGFLFQLGRVLTTKVTLDDEGLTVRGKPVVPFDSMTSLDTSRFRKKGFVDLSYTVSGADKTVRLDEYVIRDFRPIIAAICSRGGFENPLPAPAAATAATDTE